MKVVRDGGIVVPVSDDQFKGERGVFVSQFPYQAEIKSEFHKMIEDIANEEIKLTIEKVYHFEEALDALQNNNTSCTRKISN